MTEKEKSMEKEVEVLRKAGRDRERDLDTLNTVLHCNQDIINVRTHTHTHIVVQNTHTYILTTLCTFVLSVMHRSLEVLFRYTCVLTLFQDLRVALGEKESLLKEVAKEREVWRQRDRALATVLHEKEALIRYLKEELERRKQDVQVIIRTPGCNFR